MKTLLLASFFTLCTSLAYAGSGCGGGGCDKDNKGEKADLITSSADFTISCAGSCDSGKKDKTAPKTDLIEATSTFAGSGCCDKKEDPKTKTDYTTSIEIAA